MKRPAANGRVLLLEIGTEEIPARMLGPALKDLAQGLYNEIVGRSIAPSVGFTLEGNFETFGTPRRLAVRASGLLAAQPDREEEVTGPPVRAAFDASGRPTKAAEGFARAQGVPVKDLRRVTSPKGECVAVRRAVRGSPAAEVLAEAIPPLVLRMTFPKTMRWGAGEHRFVRPIHSVVALLDEEVIEMVIAGIRSGRETFGHRFAGTARIPLRHPGEYVDALRRNGVLADVEERTKTIQDQLRREAERAGGRIAPPPGSGAGSEAGDSALLEEVTHLVEWPTVIAGEFDPAFLDLPPEILVTAMRHHQKYFSLLRPDGTVLNRFLAVANTRGDRSGAIRRGNEWVLRARLADARFFWEDDRKAPLADRSATLERVTFHEKLGSYAAKTRRMARLVEAILPAFEGHAAADRRAVEQATALCKNDLTTQMVKEFPELEGIVGGLYARADRLPEPVASAIYAHDLPRGADDPLPATPEARVVSLADRLDTQAGIFLLGIVPTGSRDPYAVRRSVQGVCRILIEGKLHISLSRCLDAALAGYDGQVVEGMVPKEQARGALLDFYRGRLQYLGEEIPLRHDSVRAALAASFDDPFDARLRMEALEAIRREADFESLVVAHKRIKNILPGPADEAARHREPGTTDLKEDAERRLHADLLACREGVEQALLGRDYGAALRRIARLRPALDRFFESVMVMAEDRALRDNRLALLAAVGGLFLRIGDFSEIVQEGEPAARAHAQGTKRPGSGRA